MSRFVQICGWGLGGIGGASLTGGSVWGALVGGALAGAYWNMAKKGKFVPGL